jgi:hypothetical protein
MIAAMVAPWLIATIHHGFPAQHDQTSSVDALGDSLQAQLR